MLSVGVVGKGVAGEPEREQKRSQSSEGCGVGRCRPRWLQRCSTMKLYIAVYSLILMLQLAYVSYFVGCVRTVEKRFGLSSTKSSFLINSSDIVQTCVVIFVGYFGRKLHKPRFLGTSVTICALGALVAASPYFIFGPYQYDPAVLRSASAGRPAVGLQQVGPPEGRQAGRQEGLLTGVPDEQQDGERVGHLGEPGGESRAGYPRADSRQDHGSAVERGGDYRSPGGRPDRSMTADNQSNAGPGGGLPGYRPPVPPRIKGSRIHRGPALRFYQMCSADVAAPTGRCDAKSSTEREANYTAYLILIIAGVFLGLGNSGLITIGIAFIDENVKKENSAMYIGIASSMHIWGPIVGFSTAAFSTRLPEDLGEAKLSPYHPAFIGCWWLGSVIIGTLLLIIAIPMFFFPRHFQPYYIYHKKPVDTNSKKNTLLEEIKGLPLFMWRILRNSAFMLLVCSKLFCCYYIMGVAINVSRYIEIHFGQPAFVANLGTALCGALVGGMGSLFGGFIMKKKKLQVRGAVNIYVGAISGTIIGLFILMLIPCPQAPTAYHDTPLTSLGLNVNQECNSGCTCSRDHYQPVCTPEGLEYFSPCHAGCRGFNENQTLTNCSCVSDPGTPLSADWCGGPCNRFVPYMAVLAVIGFLGSMARVPGTVLIFRLVDADLKAFALGITSFLLNLVVFVPGPILFGHVFDSACILWRTACGEKRNCLVYNTASFRKYMHGITAGFELTGLVFAIVMLVVVRRRLASENHARSAEAELQALKSQDKTRNDDADC